MAIRMTNFKTANRFLLQYFYLQTLIQLPLQFLFFSWKSVSSVSLNDLYPDLKRIFKAVVYCTKLVHNRNIFGEKQNNYLHSVKYLVLVNILTIRVIDLRKHAVTMKLLLGYLLTLVFYEVLHCLVESTLTGTFYFLFHVIPFIKCAVGREMWKRWGIL